MLQGICQLSHRRWRGAEKPFQFKVLGRLSPIPASIVRMTGVLDPHGIHRIFGGCTEITADRAEKNGVLGGPESQTRLPGIKTDRCARWPWDTRNPALGRANRKQIAHAQTPDLSTEGQPDILEWPQRRKTVSFQNPAEEASRKRAPYPFSTQNPVLMRVSPLWGGRNAMGRDREVCRGNDRQRHKTRKNGR
jgi:hypothetical protein